MKTEPSYAPPAAKRIWNASRSTFQLNPSSSLKSPNHTLSPTFTFQAVFVHNAANGFMRPRKVKLSLRLSMIVGTASNLKNSIHHQDQRLALALYAKGFVKAKLDKADQADLPRKKNDGPEAEEARMKKKLPITFFLHSDEVTVVKKKGLICFFSHNIFLFQPVVKAPSTILDTVKVCRKCHSEIGRGKTSFFFSFFFGQRSQRGQSPAEHMGTFVHLSVCPSIRQSPPGSLRPEICPLRPRECKKTKILKQKQKNLVYLKKTVFIRVFFKTLIKT